MKTSLLKRGAHLGRLGFTLIELLAVIVIIGILAMFLVPEIPGMIDKARVTACSKNLQEIYKGLLSYDHMYPDQGIPPEGGVRFFTCLIYQGVLDNTKANARRMSCPGVKPSGLDIAGRAPTEWYSRENKALITEGSSAYAGRDVKKHPLRRLAGTEPLVCDDNDGMLNHMTTTNVLYGDGSVQTFEIFALKDEGIISEDETNVWVGPDADVDDLKKFKR